MDIAFDHLIVLILENRFFDESLIELSVIVSYLFIETLPNFPGIFLTSFLSAR